MRAVLIAFLSGAAVALASAPLLAQQGANVTIASFKFGPENVSAAAKAPITWVNKDGAPHQVVVASKNLKTAVLNKDQSGQLTINEAGTYDYICGLHPSMKGKIVVK